MKIFYLIILLLISCARQKESSQQNDQASLKTKYFKTTFLNHFKVLELPCVIGEGKSLKEKGFVSLNPLSLDSLITHSNQMVCYGILKDTTQFYTSIFYTPSATYTPVIITYNKDGNEISNKVIDFGCWDGAPYDYTCDGNLKIDKQMNLTLEHTITCFDCDSTSTVPIKYSESRKGQISTNGTIELEDPRINNKNQN